MTPVDLSIKGAIEDFEQGAAMNPIQQAISALEESGAWAPGVGRAMDILRSLKKEVEGAVASVCRAVAELPDRNSPADWPEAMLVTHDELADAVRTAIAAALGRASQPTQAAVRVPQIDYDALIAAARGKSKNWTQGSNGRIAFKCGAEWFREQVLAAPEAPAQATQPTSNDLADAAGILNAHGHAALADRLLTAAEAAQPTQGEAPTQRIDAPSFGPCPAISRDSAEAAWAHGCLTGYRAARSNEGGGK